MSIDKPRARTLTRRRAKVSVVVPAHNEAETIAEVVASAYDGLKALDTEGEVIVSASGCTDDTAERALDAGAQVVDAPIGKGAAILRGIAASTGDIVCLIDGDLQYFGEKPLVAVLTEPILRGIADACIGNLYWRPVFPDQWLNGFFAPLAGLLFPEILPKVGSTPWSGQRAAERQLWPTTLPDGYTSDLAIVLHWNDHATMLRPVLTDDWFNPVRPKPELLALDFELLVGHAIERGRLTESARPALNAWFEDVQRRVDAYRDGEHEPIAYQKRLFEASLAGLRRISLPAGPRHPTNLELA